MVILPNKTNFHSLHNKLNPFTYNRGCRRVDPRILLINIKNFGKSLLNFTNIIHKILKLY